MNPDIAFTVDLPNAPASYLEELQDTFKRGCYELSGIFIAALR